MNNRTRIIVILLGVAMIVSGLGQMAGAFFEGPLWMRIVLNGATIVFGVGLMVLSARTYRALRLASRGSTPKV